MNKLFKIGKIIGSLVLASISSSIFAQSASISAEIDKVEILIGEQATITLEASFNNSKNVHLPYLSDTIVSGIELVSKSKVDTIDLDNNRKMLRQNIIVTSFDSAFYYIPPFYLYDGEQKIAESGSLALKVFTVQVDEESDEVNDIKPIMNISVTWKEIGKIILVIWLSVVALFLIVLLYYKFIKKEDILIVAKEPEVPSYVVALEKLGRLNEEKPWKNGAYKEYFTDLTDTLRVYIGKRFQVDAMEMTSDELLKCMKQLDQKDSIKLLEQILGVSDFVKFAKLTPSEEECVRSLNNAYSFVNDTKVELTPDENLDTNKTE